MNKKNMIGITIVIIILACFFVFRNNRDDANTIVIWAHSYLADAAEKAVEIYLRENPGTIYDFEVVRLGQDDLRKKIQIGLSTGSLANLPDIFFDEDYNFMQYIHFYGEHFADLTDYINKEDFYDFKIKNATYNDRIFAVPYDCGVGVLFYRTDLIEQAGFTDEDMQNLTWERYIEIGQEVKRVTGVDMLTLLPRGNMEGRLLYRSANTWFFDENGNANIANNQAFIDSIQTLKKLYESNIVYMSSSWDDMINAISNEKVASHIGASWWAPIIQGFEDQAGLWNVAIMPRMTGSDDYINNANLGGGSWFVLNRANSAVAIDFVISTFATSQELADYVVGISSYVPTNKNFARNLTESPNEFFNNQKLTTIFTEFAQNIHPVRYGLHANETNAAIGPIMVDFLNGNITLDNALSLMQSAAERISAD